MMMLRIVITYLLYVLYVSNGDNDNDGGNACLYSTGDNVAWRNHCVN